MLIKRKRKTIEVSKVKFLVIKGKISYPGSHGLEYAVFDLVEFDPLKDIETQKRKYTWRKMYEIDNKNPWAFKEYVLPRKRHIMAFDERILTTITIFDHIGANIYYGFIPIDDLK
jgi:hypothetical protein